MEKFLTNNWQWMISIIFIIGTIYASFRNIISSLKDSVSEIKSLVEDVIIMKERLSYGERMIAELKEVHKEISVDIKQMRDAVMQLSVSLAGVIKSERDGRRGE